MQVAKRASQRLSVLRRTKPYFSAEQLLSLYKAQVRPVMEYCSHIWGGSSPTNLEVFNKLQHRVCKIIDKPIISNQLWSLQSRRDVAALTVFYRLVHGKCSSELSCLLPDFNQPKRHTRQTVRQHSLTLNVGTCRSETFKQSFIPRTTVLWNKLPQSCFPKEYNVQVFKSKINKLLTSEAN